MSDVAMATLVTGLVTITTMICGVVTLWLKIRDGQLQAQTIGHKADAAAQKAGIAAGVVIEAANKVDSVITKLDENTEMTRNVVDAINGTHGTPTKLEQLGAYDHQAKHEIVNAINALSLKIERLLVGREGSPLDRK